MLVLASSSRIEVEKNYWLELNELRISPTHVGFLEATRIQQIYV